MKFYLHVPPLDKITNSGGVRALHRLGDELEERGFEVVKPGVSVLVYYADEPGVIHVVGEAGAKPFQPHEHVVRWLLGPRQSAPGPNELEVTWSSILHPECPRLVVDIVEHSLFYPKTTPGSGVLYYNGKGPVWVISYDVTYGAPGDPNWTEITRSWPSDRAVLADMLRGAELLVSNDGYTNLNLESTLCGTPVLVLRNYIGDRGFGIATDWSELEEAKRSVAGAGAHYAEEANGYGATVDRFVNLCRERWG